MKLTPKNFESILDNYNIGKYKNHKYIFTGGNLVYRLITTKGKFILKVYLQGSNSHIKYQIKLMEFLKNKEVTTPKIMNTKKGKGVLIWEKNKIAIQEFADGKKIQYANKELARSMGKEFGKLDKTLLKFKKNKGRLEDNSLRLVRWSIDKIYGQNVKEESKKVFEEIKRLDIKKIRKSMIHGDLCEGNFLVKNNKVSAIIDWDDVREDFLVYEIAVPIAHNLTTKRGVRKEEIRIFLREYQKFIKLNEEEKKSVFLFAKHRMMSAGAWSYDQIKKHTKMKSELMGWVEFSIKQYNALNKLSLEEFLGLLK